jgi:hypothetical protein
MSSIRSTVKRRTLFGASWNGSTSPASCHPGGGFPLNTLSSMEITMRHRFAVMEYFKKGNQFYIPEGWVNVATFVRLEDAMSFIGIMKLSGRQMQVSENKENK